MLEVKRAELRVLGFAFDREKGEDGGWRILLNYLMI